MTQKNLLSFMKMILMEIILFRNLKNTNAGFLIVNLPLAEVEMTKIKPTTQMVTMIINVAASCLMADRSRWGDSGYVIKTFKLLKS